MESLRFIKILNQYFFLFSCSFIYPSSGPTAGGTTVTINGTELGVSVEDILSITLGDSRCQVDENSYIPGIHDSEIPMLLSLFAVFENKWLFLPLIYRKADCLQH